MNEGRLAKCVAVLGTGSDVGKSVAVAALCRLLSDAGLRVAPFKAQNMSNNSWVTYDGGEMGRAQVVQAQAARVEPHVDMNPVLLKPNTDLGAQVVLHGRVLGDREASDYWKDTEALAGEAAASLRRLRERFDVIVIEGAGSCAELNLRDRDFVNFRTAHAADAAVILIGDIDRGGVFAQIIGTLAILPEGDRARVKAFLVNRFRGDARLFDDGLQILEKRTGLPSLGLIPMYRDIDIDAEDALPLDAVLDPPEGPRSGRVNVAVLCLPHLSNFTDFAALAGEESVTVHYLTRPRPLAGYDLVLIPGSKNVRGDWRWMSERGWPEAIRAYADSGGQVGGICGGYQILGRRVDDPDGVEGAPGSDEMLALLDVETTLATRKTLTRVAAVWRNRATGNDVPVEGYEIHMGKTTGPDTQRPFTRIREIHGRGVDIAEGARGGGGRVWGTYLHGLFDAPEFRRSFLARFEAYRPSETAAPSIDAHREAQYDKLAAHFRRYLNLPVLEGILGISLRSEG
ncbi:MAG: cobyric acid synthase [Deltaproteobacteria bacterium]|nr:cobyric acid synthase [Deltaproteobacteria bacterium]